LAYETAHYDFDLMLQLEQSLRKRHDEDAYTIWEFEAFTTSQNNAHSRSPLHARIN
jgi:hypothetical protein